MQRIPAKLSPIWLLPLLVHYLVHTKSLLCVGGEWRDGIAVPLILCFYVQPTEDPETFLNRRPLTTPLVLVDENQDAFLCIGTDAIPFPKRYLGDAALYIIAYYYALHMTYPKCVACVLSILQTEVLGDSIHDKDATSAFKRARTDWKAFLA